MIWHFMQATMDLIYAWCAMGMMFVTIYYHIIIMHSTLSGQLLHSLYWMVTNYNH